MQETEYLITVMVSSRDPNVPIMITFHDLLRGIETTSRFFGFTAKEPDASDFAIPFACKQDEMSNKGRQAWQGSKMKPSFPFTKKVTQRSNKGKEFFRPKAFL